MLLNLGKQRSKINTLLLLLFYQQPLLKEVMYMYSVYTCNNNTARVLHVYWLFQSA